MSQKDLGIDSIGIWTPQQYAIDCGWSLDQVLATAGMGIALEDLNELGEDRAAELVRWCEQRSEPLAEGGTA
jgi:hypothetical protein